MIQAIIQARGQSDIYFQKVQKAKQAKQLAWEMQNIFGVKVIAIFYIKPKAK